MSEALSVDEESVPANQLQEGDMVAPVHQLQEGDRMVASSSAARSMPTQTLLRQSVDSLAFRLCSWCSPAGIAELSGRLFPKTSCFKWCWPHPSERSDHAPSVASDSRVASSESSLPSVCSQKLEKLAALFPEESLVELTLFLCSCNEDLDATQERLQSHIQWRKENIPIPSAEISQQLAS